MSISNLLQDNNYSIYAENINAKVLNIEDINTEQLTLDNGANSVVLTPGANDSLIVSGGIYTDNILFSTASTSSQSILSFYVATNAINVVFTDSNSNTYNAELRCVRIGNLCNITVKPSGNSFNVPTTCDFINSSSGIVPIDLRPLQDTYFTISSLVGSPAQGVLLYCSVGTSGTIEIIATSSGGTIPNANYVTSSFNATYHCNA